MTSPSAVRLPLFSGRWGRRAISSSASRAPGRSSRPSAHGWNSTFSPLNGQLRQQIRSWLPDTLRVAPLTLDQWIEAVVRRLLEELEEIRREIAPAQAAQPNPQADLRG